MSNQPQLGFDHSILDLSSTMAPPPMSQGQSASSSGNPDWIPPPASLTAINSDGIDLNDEIFFNYNPVPSHTPYTETYAISNDVEASSSTSSIATLPYNALQSTITTPDLTLASPQKFDANLHYSHRRRFSSAVEQLNRMSIHQHKSKSPSPDVYPVLAHPANTVEERTINPRQLLGVNSGGMSGATSAGQNTVPASSRYILPSSVSSPSLSTFFSRGGDMVDMDFQGQEVVANGMSGSLDMSEMQEIPLSANGDGVIGVNSYVMNDECVSAITSWLNNTDNIISDRADGAAMRNPTGIVKPNWKRRNSIQVLPHRNEAAPQRMPPSQKRKRRKSINNSIPEDMVPAQVYQNSQSPGTSYAPQFSSMNSFGMEPELQQDQSPVSGLEVSQEAFQRTNEALRTQETPRYGSVSTVPMVEKPASRQLSVTDGDDEPKPFPCPECEKQFKRSEHLKRHIRSVHSNIRPFHCKYCDKKFSRSDNLAQHSKTHFKVNANGTTTIIYGNPNPNNRGGRKKSVSSDGGQGTGQDSQ